MLSFSVAAFVPQKRQVAHAAETDINRVEVCGVGEASVVPDIAEITVAINTESESAVAAEDENVNALDRVINVLINAGVAEENVKTTSYSMYERTKTDGENQTTIYSVSSVLTFKTSANADLEGLIQNLTEAGVSQVYGVRFEVSDQTKFYNAALEAAIANASKKATTIFGGSNFKIVKVIELSNAGCEVMPLNLARAKGFPKGTQTVSAYVRVVFETI